MKKQMLVAGLIGLGFAASALAGAPEHAPVAKQNHWYAGAQAGLVFPAGDGSSLLDSASYGLGAHIGYKLNKLRLEEAYNFYNHNYTDSVESLTGAQDMRFSTLMTNLYYDIQTGTNFVPFVGAGIGWLHAWGDTTVGSASIGDYFAYQGIAGLDYKIKPNMTVGVNYHYLNWSNSANDHDHIVNATLNYYFQ